MPWRRMGEWRCNSTILDVNTRWRWVVNLTPWPLSPGGKSPGTNCIEDWEGPVARLDTVEKNSGRSARRYTDWAIPTPIKSACHLPLRWVLVRLILRSWEWRSYIPPETSVDFQRTTWRYNPEDSIVHNRCCENFKFCVVFVQLIIMKALYSFSTFSLTSSICIF
jgi:hypothetical protein